MIPRYHKPFSILHANRIFIMSDESARGPAQNATNSTTSVAMSAAMLEVIQKYSMNASTKARRATIPTAMKVIIAKYSMSDSTREHRAATSTAMTIVVAKYAMDDVTRIHRVAIPSSLKVIIAKYNNAVMPYDRGDTWVIDGEELWQLNEDGSSSDGIGAL